MPWKGTQSTQKNTITCENLIVLFSTAHSQLSNHLDKTELRLAEAPGKASPGPSNKAVKVSPFIPRNADIKLQLVNYYNSVQPW